MAIENRNLVPGTRLVAKYKGVTYAADVVEVQVLPAGMLPKDAPAEPDPRLVPEIRYRLEEGMPVIEGSLAWLVCALDSELQRGDHLVAFGHVLDGDVDEAAEPLLFYRSTYRPLTDGTGAS